MNSRHWKLIWHSVPKNELWNKREAQMSDTTLQQIPQYFVRNIFVSLKFPVFRISLLFSYLSNIIFSFFDADIHILFYFFLPFLGASDIFSLCSLCLSLTSYLFYNIILYFSFFLPLIYLFCVLPAVKKKERKQYVGR